MIPQFQADGNLPPGVHWATWDEVCDRYGTTRWRRQLLNGLRSAIESLRLAGCQTVYLDGSFVSSKPEPGDFDACWEVTGVDESRVDPVLLTFNDGRAAQKAKFGGELFPATLKEGKSKRVFLDFFQTNKVTGGQKGIVALDLGGLA